MFWLQTAGHRCPYWPWPHCTPWHYDSLTIYITFVLSSLPWEPRVDIFLWICFLFLVGHIPRLAEPNMAVYQNFLHLYTWRVWPSPITDGWNNGQCDGSTGRDQSTLSSQGWPVRLDITGVLMRDSDAPDLGVLELNPLSVLYLVDNGW